MSITLLLVYGCIFWCVIDLCTHFIGIYGKKATDAIKGKYFGGKEEGAELKGVGPNGGKSILAETGENTSVSDADDVSSLVVSLNQTEKGKKTKPKKKKRKASEK